MAIQLLICGVSAFASKDAKGWWDVLEVNIRGPINFIQ